MPEFMVGLATQSDCVFCHLSDGVGEKVVCGNPFQSITVLIFLSYLQRCFLVYFIRNKLRQVCHSQRPQSRQEGHGVATLVLGKTLVMLWLQRSLIKSKTRDGRVKRNSWKTKSRYDDLWRSFPLEAVPPF